MLAQSDLPTPQGREFWHVLPCSASTVRDRQRSSITLLDDFDNERRKVCCKVSLYKNCQQQIVVHSIAFRVVSICWQGDEPFPLKSCLQVTCPLLSMVYPMGDVRTRNSRRDSRRIFKLRGGVDHIWPAMYDQWPKSKGQRSRSQGHVTYQQQ